MKKYLPLILIALLFLALLCPITAQSIGVTIGDSLCAGYPGTGSGPFQVLDAEGHFVPNQYGSVAYALEQRTGTYWFNLGTGGDTTGDVWARWRRDVLAEIYDPGDGRGNRSITIKPNWVVVICGVNDVNPNLTITDEEIKNNYIAMAQSLANNNIKGYILTVPPNVQVRVDRLPDYVARIQGLNGFIRNELPAYGNGFIKIIDYYRWYNDSFHGRNCYPDPELQGNDGTIHMMPDGYNKLGKYIANHIQF